MCTQQICLAKDAAWRVVEEFDETDASVECLPRPPIRSSVIVRGTLGHSPRPEYHDTYLELRGQGVLTLIVQRQLDPIWGLRVWRRSRSSDAVWWLASTHVQNTLLDDPSFRKVFEEIVID